MLICFEGIDGSGKTTVSSAVAARLRERGIRVAHARENERMASRIAGNLRALTRDVENFVLDPRAELMIQLAREAELLAAVRPNLGRGEVAISDRYVYSHYAMARARGLDVDLAELVALTGGVQPDLVIFVDCDPDVAWLRKRARKIQSHRIDEEGRKGAVVEGLGEKMRDIYRGLAAQHGWETIDTTHASVAGSVGEALSAVCRRLGLAPPAPADGALQPWRFDGGVETLPDRFFEWLRGVAPGEPDLAAVLLLGMDAPRAAALRFRLAPRVPALVAAGLGGLEGDDAWRLRRALREREPDYVARSLEGLANRGDALELREELSRVAPAGVLVSLTGAADEEAHDLREQLWEAAPQAGLLSLRGAQDLRSWAWRYREFKRRPSSALARSLGGVDSEAAWALRERLREPYPFSVVRSVSGLSSQRAWELRRGAGAGKVVMETIAGLDDAAAWELRHACERTLPETVAASLRGLAGAEAFAMRERLAGAAPLGVLRSLKGLLRVPRGAELLRFVVRRHGSRLRVARDAVRMMCNEFGG